ncbi:uncharacterized protein DKFZp434B061-like [Penaeus indicus]|uniref:uncharacterized protein DKFZp434B061-like n=1 Tax=Penaeus indicus TaxID=29960 RepID=UPI00300C55A5
MMICKISHSLSDYLSLDLDSFTSFALIHLPLTYVRVAIVRVLTWPALQTTTTMTTMTSARQETREWAAPRTPRRSACRRASTASPAEACGSPLPAPRPRRPTRAARGSPGTSPSPTSPTTSPRASTASPSTWAALATEARAASQSSLPACARAPALPMEGRALPTAPRSCLWGPRASPSRSSPA